MTMRSVVIANRHPRLRFDRRGVIRSIHTLDAHAEKFRGGPPAGELSLVFLSDATLARLHADFLSDPTLTDVITFAGDTTAELAGEICVSADAARRQAGSRPRAFATELLLYVVHGWLHLAGYDDLQPAKKRVMRRAEARAMRLLRAAQVCPAAVLRQR